MNSSKNYLRAFTKTAFLLLIIGIILGAFGAHGLKKVTEEKDILAAFETAVKYQIYGAFVLFILPLVGDFYAFNVSKKALLLFSIGIVLFSGSIYLLTFAKIRNFELLRKISGPITPIGGSFQIFSLAVVFFQFLTSKKE